ncbi:MAG: gliding motility protein RemB [Flavobacteriales bacterium]|nr:gliding motility protein RemB [Flavobacteriales bacterium]
MNQLGTNSHTAQKPYLYQTVNKYLDLEARDKQLFKDKTSWFGRKFWNEHMVTFKGENYWFTLDPGVDLQAGKDFDSDINSTYNNTRLAVVQGGLGKKLNFHTVIYESQGRFADYFNRYAESIAADGGGNPAIIPGMGIAKAFKTDSYDYPVATGYLSYSPNEMFNFQFGHGKNFLGDGYRSLLLSDVASPSPFLKVNTTFWKLKYTNTWMSLRDVRQEATVDGAFTTKYMATHYLSYNVTKRLNIGLFESVLWDNSNNRGFDVNYLNPIIFYRAIEFSTGPRSGNALIGLSGKYKFSNQIQTYGQMIIDEFSSGDIFGGEKSWKNKIGYQIGAKYFEPFGIQHFYLQAEYNQVRPFTYSHNTIVLNYGHNNQSMAHLWGANFKEFIAIARYEKGRIFGSAKLIFGERGFDFNDGTDDFNYGGDIYRDERDRPFDFGNEIAQGNNTNVFHGEFQAGYLINPSTNLKIYASLIYRDFNPEANTETTFKNSTTWLNFGIRTDIFNWYYDF